MGFLQSLQLRADLAHELQAEDTQQLNSEQVLL